MENKFIAIKDEYIVGGLAAVAASASVYGFACWSGLGDDFFGIFIINYAIACIYCCALWFTGRFRSGRNGLRYIFPAMVLFLISAYSLNHMIPIFEHAAPWLSVTVVIASIAYTAVPFFDTMPPWLRNFVALVMGIGSVLFVYLAVYLLPLFPVGVIAGIGLGISLHAFVPLLFVIFTAIWLFRNGPRYRGVLRSFFCGSIMPLVVVGVFCWQWNSIDRLVSSRFQHSLVDADTDLPSWIKVAQVIPHTHVAEAYLKGDLVYSTANPSWDLPGFSRGRNTFDEVRKHDPLVLIASLLNRNIQMTEEERIRILRAEFKARHKTEVRLWSGSDLETTHVITAVKLWPQFRMAYTEKTITVANRTKESWLGSQEAIYTFQLPEGGVVSSLSLWIDGVESKGILTTKGKADSAYKSIVGVERRDPSVVHWQEGNKVSVRVFPVPQMGNRIFKIGITAPLAVHHDQLEYRNISFDGPWTNDAKELVQIKWEQEPDAALMQGFEEKGNFLFEKDRRYIKDWSLHCKVPPLKANAFHFAGKTYRIAAYKPADRAVVFEKVYLDLNGTWKQAEVEQVLAALEGKDVYVYDDGLIKVRADNRGHIFDRYRNRAFSIFPLQVIQNPATALLITKSGTDALDIGDLKGTVFAERLESWLAAGAQLSVYNIGDELNLYLKTLKEHRAFTYAYGSVPELARYVEQGLFTADQEDNDHVVINHAGVVISRSLDSAGSNAPDHLMRLFAYNHLMQQLKTGIFKNLESDSTLVHEAQEANVVTPLSSLVVLETQADYDRFGIKNETNSLKNATMKGSGAVPEPHEWALIILTAALLFWITYKKRIRSLWARS